MLPSEDLCPWGNNKEDGLSGHLEPQRSEVDLGKMILLSEAVARQPSHKRMELGLNWERARVHVRRVSAVRGKRSRVWPISKPLS